jgi:hypothetical protein
MRHNLAIHNWRAAYARFNTGKRGFNPVMILSAHAAGVFGKKPASTRRFEHSGFNRVELKTIEFRRVLAAQL